MFAVYGCCLVAVGFYEFLHDVGKSFEFRGEFLHDVGKIGEFRGVEFE
jgi:hypothetical protein